MMKRRLRHRVLQWGLVPASAFVFALPLFAQQDSTASDPRQVQPERPTVATHAHTVAPGYVEIESGVQGDRVTTGQRDYFTPTVVKVGLASNVQLNLGVPFVFVGPGQSSGLGDVSVGVKWRVLDDHPVLGDFALLPAIKFPTGSSSDGTGTGTTDAGLTLIASYDIQGVSMDLNVAYARVGIRGATPASNTALWTASFGIPVAGRLSWAFEVFGFPTIDGSGAPSTAGVLTGPTFLVSPALNLDMGLISPFHGDMPNSLYAGVVWNLGALLPARSAPAKSRSH